MALPPPPSVNIEFNYEWRQWLHEVYKELGMASSDFYADVAQGKVPGHRIIHKFGSGNVGTSPVPVTSSGVWKTPTTETALEIVSNNAADDVGSTGATKVTIHGIDTNWVATIEEVELNGTTAVPLTIDILRLHRWYVSESGSYADETTASHVGTLTIREAGVGATWDTIQGVSPFPGQSEIGVLTIPYGHTGYILAKNIFTDTTKQANVYFLQRPFANDIITPYAGVRKIIERDIGVSGQYSIDYKIPKGPFVGPCDIGFMAEVTVGTADVSVEYEMLLVQDGY